MNLLRSGLLLFALLFVGGCFHSSGGSGTPGGAGPGSVSATVTGGGRVLLSPLAVAAVALGTIVLTNTFAAGTVDGDIRFRVQGTDIEADQSEVVLAPGESRQVFVRALPAAVLLATLSVVVIAELVVSGLVQNFTIEWVNAAFNSDVGAMFALFGNPQLQLLWFTATVLAPIAVLTRHSSALVPPKLPSLITEIRLMGAMVLFWSLAQLAATFEGTQDNVPFPDGPGPNGYTVAATPTLPLTEGEYCTFWMSVSEAVPLNDQTQRYTYAFVMDSDANVANNYVASPSFPNDFYDGTDRWYELNYTPAGGWSATCKTVGAGNTISTVPTAARFIVRGDSILLFVPRSEFVLNNPPFRATSFCHTGDFGISPPHSWSGDPTPTVAEALHAWQ